MNSPFAMQAKTYQRYTIWGLTFLCLAVISYLAMPDPGVDWRVFASVNWLSPYSDHGFFNPPWVAGLIPWSLLPLSIGAAVNRSALLLAVAVWLRRHNAGIAAHLIVFTSAPFLAAYQFNNIDWLVLAALMMPPAYALPVLLVKPQIASGVVLVWLKRHRWKILLPVLTVLISSVVLWGLWPLEIFYQACGLHGAAWNISAWPISLIPGCWLLVRAWRDDNVVLAAIATPLMVPYLGYPSLFVPLAILSVSSDQRPAWGLYWSMWFLKFMG